MDQKFRLIQYCKDHPNDDQAPLVLADWLEEHGHASDRDRASLLRLCHARSELYRSDSNEAGILSEIYRVVQRNRHAWFEPIVQRLPVNVLYVGRGFPVVYMDLTDHPHWYRDLPETPESDPIFAWIEGCVFKTRKPELPRFAKSFRDPRLRWISFVHFDGLFREPSHWNRLNLSSPILSAKAARVAGLPGSDYGQAIAECPIFRNVQSLNLQQSAPPMDDAAIQEIAQARWLTNVTNLTLAGNRIGPSGLQSLLDSPHLGQLTHLNLACNPIGDEGIERLANCARLSSLKVLKIRRTGMGADGVRALAKSPHLRNLKLLCVQENQLEDVGVEALARSNIFESVEDIALSGLSDHQLRSLSSARWLKSLRKLSLTIGFSGRNGLESLVNSSSLSQLRNLQIHGDEISPAAFASLFMGKGLQSVRNYRLQIFRIQSDNRQIAEVDLDPLLRNSCLPSLKGLDFWIPANASTSFARVLRESQLLRRLTRFDFQFFDWDDSAFEGLFRLIDEGTLQDLSFCCAPLVESTMKRFVNCPGLSRLTRLAIRESTGLRQRSLKALMTSPHLRNLAMLDLDSCRIGSAVKSIIDSTLSNLVWFRVCEGSDFDPIYRNFQKRNNNVFLEVFRNHPPWQLDFLDPEL